MTTGVTDKHMRSMEVKQLFEGMNYKITGRFDGWSFCASLIGWGGEFDGKVYHGMCGVMRMGSVIGWLIIRWWRGVVGAFIIALGRNNIIGVRYSGRLFIIKWARAVISLGGWRFSGVNRCRDITWVILISGICCTNKMAGILWCKNCALTICVIWVISVSLWCVNAGVAADARG